MLVNSLWYVTLQPLAIEKRCDEFASHGESTAPLKLSDSKKTTGVGSLWNDVVERLEQSVQSGLISGDASEVLQSIKLLRQFAVGSAMNKCVIGNSDVIRPRLLQLLDRNRWWAEKDSNVCVDLCGLINSIVRDCSALSKNILTRSDILVQLIDVILHSDTDAVLQESCLLLLRSLFGAEELSSVLSQATQIRSRHAAALRLFTDNVIRRLITLCWPGLQSPTSSSSAKRLTGKSRCYLMQLLSLLATDRQLVGCLRRCDAVRLCHHVILTAVCDHPKTCTLGLTPTGCKTPVNRVACVRAIDPANQLAARFALKLLVHLFFHVPDALEAFSEVFPEDQHPSKLLYCYGQLAGSVPPNVPGVSHQVPSGHRIKRMRKFVTTTSQDDQKASPASFTSKSSAGDSPEHVRIPVSSCGPSAHGTQVCLGLLRGLIYWRLLNQSSSQSVDAIDQFGNPVTSAPGLGLSDDDVALLVIQPLTDACLHTDDIRILSWICHVLVLVLGRRPELHQWTVYANSFIREVDVRVTSLIKAVQAASNCPTLQSAVCTSEMARWLKWLEREFTDRKVRGSNPTSASRLPLSRFGQPGSIPALVLPLGGMAALATWQYPSPRASFGAPEPTSTGTIESIIHTCKGARWPNWLEREFTDRKVRGSNPTSASRLPLSRFEQPGSISALVLPSGGMAARQRKGVTAQRLFITLL
ncbi:hypothetical protein CSKR_107586 [Clonorchis sinensis]|uniref:Uncharacterized protein n=1 Tax=Clonorchis sinensis TaxID=79923 RepID=A0A8T1MDL8_CLOSI|nr:hypothetical protein CSKR_107586 [Clonorchis sinensis]